MGESMHRAAGYGSSQSLPPASNAQLAPISSPSNPAMLNNLPSLTSPKRGLIPIVLSDDQSKEAREIFDSFDTNKNGTIERDELDVGVRKLLGGSMSEELIKVQVKSLWQESDANLSGGIDFNEFTKVLNTLKLNNCINFDD